MGAGLLCWDAGRPSGAPWVRPAVRDPSTHRPLILPSLLPFALSLSLDLSYTHAGCRVQPDAPLLHPLLRTPSLSHARLLPLHLVCLPPMQAQPDMMMFAKGIASGVPFAGVSARPELYAKMSPGMMVGCRLLLLAVAQWHNKWSRAAARHNGPVDVLRLQVAQLCSERQRRRQACLLACVLQATAHAALLPARTGRNVRRQRAGLRGGGGHHRRD